MHRCKSLSRFEVAWQGVWHKVWERHTSSCIGLVMLSIMDLSTLSRDLVRSRTHVFYEFFSPLPLSILLVLYSCSAAPSVVSYIHNRRSPALMYSTLALNIYFELTVLLRTFSSARNDILSTSRVHRSITATKYRRVDEVLHITSFGCM